MRTLLILVIAACLGFLAWQFPAWNRANTQLKEAESLVALAIDDGRVDLSLSDFPDLRRLPPNIVDAAVLEFLDISSTNISNIEGVEALVGLTHLEASQTRVADLSPLQGLSELKSLNLHDTWVEELEPLTSLTSLAELDIGMTQINSLEPVTRIPELRWLNLHSSYALDGSLEYYNELLEQVSQIEGGNAYRENYRPDSQYLSKVRFKRLLERLGVEASSG